MISARSSLKILLCLPVWLQGCTTLKSQAVSATATMTATMTATNSALNSTVTTTVETATDAVGTTMNFSAVTLGELTGITTLIKAGEQMTPRQSYHLGRLCAARVLSEQRPVDAAELSEYVNTLGKYLAMHSRSPQIYKEYQFVVLDSSVPKAVSTPGGFVFVSMGMLLLAKNEDELAAVLAHEIAHISLRHAEEAIQTANRLDLFGGAIFKTAGYATNLATETVGLNKVQVIEDLKILKVFEIFNAVTDVVLNTGFNQPQEFEADSEALDILKSAGYAPTALPAIIAKLNDDTSFIGLHPGGHSRIRRILNESGYTVETIAMEQALVPAARNSVQQKRTVANVGDREQTSFRFQQQIRLYKESHPDKNRPNLER